MPEQRTSCTSRSLFGGRLDRSFKRTAHGGPLE